MQPIIRKHAPPEAISRAIRDFRYFKKFLRLDFERRCAYCHIPESRYGPSRNYAVEHFKPKSAYPHLICHYPNLYYACACCNSFKSTLEGPFLDPCQDVYSDHFSVTSQGILLPKSSRGSYFTDHLCLNRDYLVEWRMGKIALLDQIHQLDILIQQLESDSLPDAHGIAAGIRSLRERRNDDLKTEYANWWD